MANTQVELVAPTRTLFSGEAEMVVCRTTSGELAFLADHMPYLGVLEPGVVRLVNPRRDGASATAAGEEIRLAVHGGFVEVNANRVIMLADVAELAGEIDVERARRAAVSAEQTLASAPGTSEDNPEVADATAALRRAQVRLEVAGVSA